MFFGCFCSVSYFLCTAGLWGGSTVGGGKKGGVDLSSRQSPQINIKNTLHFSFLLPILSFPYFDSIMSITPVDIFINFSKQYIGAFFSFVVCLKNIL